MLFSHDAVLDEKVVERVTEHCPRCGSDVIQEVVLQRRGLVLFNAPYSEWVDLVRRCGKGHIVRLQDKDEKLEILRHLARVDDNMSLFNSLQTGENGGLFFKRVGDITLGVSKAKPLPLEVLVFFLMVLAVLFGVFLFWQPVSQPLAVVGSTTTTESAAVQPTDLGREFYFNLKFSGIPQVETEVYLNNVSLGSTSDGFLYRRVGELKPGWGHFKGAYEGNEFKVPFEILKFDLENYGGIVIAVDKEKLWQYYSEVMDEYAKAMSRDSYFREYGAGIAGKCDVKDVSCKVVSVYNNVTSSFEHYPSEGKLVFIQSPKKTIVVEGGEYEDLNALLITLLANLDIKTYVVMTKEHTYGMACGVDRDLVREYSAKVFQRHEDLRPRGESVVLDRSFYQTIWGGELFDRGDRLTIMLKLDSTEPTTVFFLEDKDKLSSVTNKGMESSLCAFPKDKHVEGSCIIPGTGYVAVRNDGPVKARINYTLTVQREYFKVKPDDLRQMFYNLDNKLCTPVDVSLGESGYVGLEHRTNESKVATDLVTGEHYSISS